MTRHSTQLARIDANGFQTLPNGPVVPLDRHLPRDLRRMRELIAAHLDQPPPPALEDAELLRVPASTPKRATSTKTSAATSEPPVHRTPTLDERAAAVELGADPGRALTLSL